MFVLKVITIIVNTFLSNTYKILSVSKLLTNVINQKVFVSYKIFKEHSKTVNQKLYGLSYLQIYTKGLR